MVLWSVLGPDTVLLDGEASLLATRPRAVLLSLLLEPNRVVTADQLAERLWGADQPKTARNSVARFVADLRRALGDDADRIVTDGRGYQVDVRPDELDVDVVEAALAADGTGDPDRTIQQTASALDLFAFAPNRLLTDLHGTQAVARAHDELHIALRERSADLQLADGRHQDVVAELEAAVADHPFHERFWAQLMLALYRSGRQAEALQAYERLRRTVAELGLEPGPAARRVETQLLVHAPSLDHESEREARGRPAEAASFQIAEPRTSFVGRAADLEAVGEAMASNRLVSIVGLGGVGKTRLALAAARAIGQDGHQVHRVALRGVRGPEQVVTTIAAVAGVPADQAPVDAATLARVLPRQPTLLVLDGCEHLRAACGEVADTLLDRAPGLRLLVTSRAPLSVAGEHVFRLGGLDLPPATAADVRLHDSVSLFCQRMADRDAPTSDAELGTIVQICRILGGLPAAIEIAAAQTAYLSPRDLLGAIEGPGAPPGAQEGAGSSLRSILAWTWEALSPSQQQLVARMSVLGSSSTLEGVEVVAGVRQPVLADVARLVDLGLVRVDVVQGRARYALSDGVRPFAAEQLVERDEVEAARDQLVVWMRELYGRSELAELFARADLIEERAVEQRNLDVVLEHLQRRGETAELVWFATRGAAVWVHRGAAGTARRWLQPHLDAPVLPVEARSAAAAALMDAANAAGDPSQVVAMGLRSLELADGELFDWIPNVSGMLALASTLFELPFTATELSELSVVAAEASPSREDNLAMAAVWRGYLAFTLRQYEAAVVHFRSARLHSRRRGRVLLNSEVGEGLALSMAGHTHEAATAAAGWWSDPQTDGWHYIVDVARAIILARAGAAEAATEQLTAAAGALAPATVLGRADDFQTAFALLATARGDQALSEQLLAVQVPRHPLVAVVLIEHVVLALDRSGEDEWRLTVMELYSRVLEPGAVRTPSSAVPELVDWWASGDRAGAGELARS